MPGLSLNEIFRHRREKKLAKAKKNLEVNIEVLFIILSSSFILRQRNRVKLFTILIINRQYRFNLPIQYVFEQPIDILPSYRYNDSSQVAPR